MAVPLFWRVAVDATSTSQLRDAVGPQSPVLQFVPELHVTLLYLGGKSLAAAATKECERLGLTQDDFLTIGNRLEELNGLEVELQVAEVCIDQDMIVARAILPEGVPCANRIPHLTIYRHPDIPPVLASAIVEAPAQVLALPTPLKLRGVLGLQLGEARPSQLPREKRNPEEAQGPWLSVKKHSSMGCAVLTFGSQGLRNTVLKRLGESILLKEAVPIQLKPHMAKQPDGSKAPVPEAIFAGWKQPKDGRSKVDATDLLTFFEDLCAEC